MTFDAHTHASSGEKGVKAIVENAKPVDREPPRPLQAPRVAETPFPFEVLPDRLQAAAHAIQDKTQAPLVTGVQSLLATTCLAVQPYANVETLSGSYSPLSCMWMTVAPTGERKTSCDKLAMQPVNAREARLRTEYTGQYQRYRNKHAAWENEHRRILKNGSDPHAVEEELNALGKEPVPPLLPVLTTDDPTIEGIQNVLKAGWPSIGIFSSEAGQIIGGHSMNRDNRLKTIAVLSTLWDGNINKRIRKGDGLTLLPGRRACMHLMAQPGIAHQLLGDAMVQEQGFASRILAAYPEPTSGTRFYREPSPDSNAALERYSAALQSILEAPLPLRDPEGCPNELQPRPLPMASLAKERIVWYADEVEEKLSRDGVYDPIRGLANKLPEHALRLAAIFELSECLNTQELSLEATEHGIALAQYYAAEALRIATMGKTDPVTERAEKLRRWLITTWKESYISQTEIVQGNRYVRNAAEAATLIDILQSHGWLHPVEGRVTIQNTPRRNAWRIIRE